MKTHLRSRATALLGAAFATLLGSCAYDPSYYGSSGYSGGSVTYGTGQGYGYGSSSFSTSIFVGTGSSRWGYDPYCRAYYDYSRRCYYDPYLYGYYPVGYRPPIIVGAPHPYGYRSGSRYCPPPSRVTNVTLVNYRNREQAYRGTNHSWADDVRVDNRPITVRAPGGRGSESYRPGDRRESQPTRESFFGSPSTRPQPSQPSGGFNRGDSTREPGFNPSSPFQRGDDGPRTRPESGRPTSIQPPTRFNTPVAVPPPAPSRSDSGDRRGFVPSAPRSAPEPRFVPDPRSAPEPRSAPPSRSTRSGSREMPQIEGPTRGERRPR